MTRQVVEGVLGTEGALSEAGRAVLRVVGADRTWQSFQSGFLTVESFGTYFAVVALVVCGLLPVGFPVAQVAAWTSQTVVAVFNRAVSARGTTQTLVEQSVVAIADVETRSTEGAEFRTFGADETARAGQRVGAAPWTVVIGWTYFLLVVSGFIAVVATSACEEVLGLLGTIHAAHATDRIH